MLGGVQFVGIDLAWGQKAPTGLAVLDEDARLLHVSACRTDDEIVAALAPHTQGPCLVAVDAPLVVRNATGSRPAEKALSADFRRFDAGTHPSNTGKPEFADGGRAAVVAKRLGLDVDPRSRRPRRAIEVYPHAASVVLFDLDRILRYKNKPGRDLALLRTELLRLVGLVETLVTPDDAGAWAALRRGVEQATRKSQLRVVEDQVDAVLCAYVGLFSVRHPDATTVYGDLETGYIVTPTLTGAHRSAAPSHAEVVRRAVQAYAADHAALLEAGRQAVALVTGVLDDAGINYLSVSGRTKTVASFAEKAARTSAGVPLFSDPAGQISDVLGVRVITYVASDVDVVAELLGDQVTVTEDRDWGEETASQGRFGYASRHLQIAVDPAREGRADRAALVGRVVQVQVRTVLQHAWAEFEHDIRYKGSVPVEHAQEFDRRFTLAAGLLELADREFAEIRDRLRGGERDPGAGELDGSGDPDDPRLDPRELAVFLAGQFSDAPWSRTDHYGWISGLLLELGITSFDELGQVLRPVDHAAIAAAMDYRYPPGAVRRLDDALLRTFGERYVGLHGNAHRVDLLGARLERLG